MYFILFILLFFGSFAHATQAKIEAGQVVFATATVNGDIAWTATRRDEMETDYNASVSSHSATVVNLQAANYEVSISTLLSPFESYSEFLRCQTKAGLRIRLQDIKKELDLLSDLSDTDSTLQRKYDWLKEYYGTL